jgi:hypothetical protein
MHLRIGIEELRAQRVNRKRRGQMRITRNASSACLAGFVLTVAAGGFFAASASEGDVSAANDANPILAQVQDESAATPSADGLSEGIEDADPLPSADTGESSGMRVRLSTVVLGPDEILKCEVFRLDHITRQKVPVKKIDLKLIQDGQEIESAQPLDEENGTFQFSMVKPGIYSMIGFGEGGFTAFSFHVGESLDEEPENAQEDATTTPFEEEKAKGSAARIDMIQTCALDPKDMPMAIQLIRAFVGTSTGRDTGPVEAIEAEMEEPEAAAPTKAPEESLAPTRHPVAAPSGVSHTSLAWHTVQLQPDGNLVGRILTLVPVDQAAKQVQLVAPQDMQVFVLRDGQVVTRASCTEEGVFSIPDLKPEIYSFVAVGTDGFAAMTIDVLPASPEEKEEGEEGTVKSASFRRVAFQIPNLQTIMTIFTTVAPPSVANFIDEIPPVTPPLNQPFTNELPPLITGGGMPGGGGSSGSGSGSGIAPVGAGNSLASSPGGFGGGAFGGGGNPGNRNNNNNQVPEIDPASSGVGLSVLVALLLLMIDLYRPR